MRPELTPGTVRMLANKFNELKKPVKWFMIGNNWRYEAPQKGRGREFYQLEANIFGESSILADLELFSLIVSISGIKPISSILSASSKTKNSISFNVNFL